MKSFRRFGLARAIAGAALGVVLVTACGDGGDSPAPAPAAPFAYVLGYELPQSPVYPAGTIIISPPNGRMAISDDGPVRVELELAGFPVQRLDGPNFQPKDNPQLRYVFGLPQALAPETLACVSAKLTVTSVSGATGQDTFGFCAGVGIGREA